MNKKGDENHWWIVSGAILILIFIGVIVFFNYGIAFPKLEEGFKSIADTEAIKKAYKETIGKESALTEEERKVIDEFNLFFQKNFAVDDDSCIKKVNFDEIKGKGFGIRVEGKDIFAEKENKARVYPLSIFLIMNLYFVDKDADRFSIDENFEKINSKFELMDVVYIKDKKIYFLDKISAADFSGKYSPVFAKKICGEEKKGSVKTLMIVNFKQRLNSYLSKEISDIILHLWFLMDPEKGGDSQSISLYEKKLENYNLVYFNEVYGNGCWRFVTSIRQKEYRHGLLYKTGHQKGLHFEELSSELVSSEGKVATINFHLLNSPECRAEDIFFSLEDIFDKIREGDECIEEFNHADIAKFIVLEDDFEIEFNRVDSSVIEGGKINTKIILRDTDSIGNNIWTQEGSYELPICFIDDKGKKKYNFYLRHRGLLKLSGIYDGSSISTYDLNLRPFSSNPLLYRKDGEVCFVSKDYVLQNGILDKPKCASDEKLK